MSAFPPPVLQTELPRGIKVPKFSKFAGEAGESIVEHVARYLVECGDLANLESIFHEQFFRRENKVNVIDLANI